MTVNTTDTGPFNYAGNGVTVSFPFTGKIQNENQVGATLLDAAGVLTVLVLNTDFTVQNITEAAADIVLTVAPPALTTLSLFYDIDTTQLTDYIEGGKFPASSHEDALDKLTLIVKQIQSENANNISMPPNFTGDAPDFPLPVSNNVIGWNTAATELINVSPDEIADIEFGSNNFIVDKFVDGVDYIAGTSTTITLSGNPGSENNTQITFDGLMQHKETYSISGLVVTFDTAIPNGVANIECMRAAVLGVGVPSDGTITDDMVSSSSNLYNRINDTVSVKDFGAVGDGITINDAAIAAAEAYTSRLLAPLGTYIVSNTVSLRQSYEGQGVIRRVDGTNLYVPNSPLVVVAIGQSNQRSTTDQVGGDMAIDPRVFFWDGDENGAGTQFNKPTLGEYPLDKTDDGGLTYSNNGAYAFARHAARMTGRDVYVIMFAEGSHNMEAFITDATRTTNGWTLPGGQTDFASFMYPGITAALALVPGAPALPDLWYVNLGEANTGDGDGFDLLRAKAFAIFNDAEAAGVYDKTQCDAIWSELPDGASRAAERLEFNLAMRSLVVEPSGGSPGDNIHNMKIIPVDGLPMSDGLHLTGESLVELGERLYGTFISPPDYNWEYYVDAEFDPILSDASTGGTAAVVGTTRGLYQARLRLVLDGGNGRPIGVGGDCTMSFQLGNIDYTTPGLTVTNDVFMQFNNFPYRARNGASAFTWSGGVEMERVAFGSYPSLRISGNLATYLTFRKNTASAVLTDLEWQDLTADGTPDIRGTITFPLEVRAP